jgi:hypothetical protein
VAAGDDVDVTLELDTRSGSDGADAVWTDERAQARQRRGKTAC